MNTVTIVKNINTLLVSAQGPQGATGAGGGGGGSGTVASVSVTAANGITGAVATATTTPAITLTLGAITPTSINGNTITTGTGTLTLAAGKTLTASNTLTLAGTDASTLSIGGGGTLGTAAYTASSSYAAAISYATTATAAGTTALTSSSLQQQFFTGTSTQTVTVPSTATITVGALWIVLNNSTGAVTVNTSTGVLLGAVPSGSTLVCTCLSTANNLATAWDVRFRGTSIRTGTGASVLATSPTLVTPALGVATATSLAASGDITTSTGINAGGVLGINAAAGVSAGWNVVAAWGCISGFISRATTGGTTTLSSISELHQRFTGTLNQDVNLPATTDLIVGQRYNIINEGTGVLTVRTSTSANTVAIVYPAGELWVTVNNNTLNIGDSWTAKLALDSANLTYSSTVLAVGGVRGSIVTQATAMPTGHTLVDSQFNGLFMNNAEASIMQVGINGFEGVTVGSNLIRIGGGWSPRNSSLPFWGFNMWHGSSSDLFSIFRSEFGLLQLFMLDAVGRAVFCRRNELFSSGFTAKLAVTNAGGTASDTVLLLQGNASQSGAYWEAQTSGATPVARLTVGGSLNLLTVGQGYGCKEGANARMGTSTLVGGSVVVSTTAVTASSRIFITGNSDGGTPGWLRVSARTAGTSFTITSSSGSDTGTVAWIIIEPT